MSTDPDPELVRRVKTVLDATRNRPIPILIGVLLIIVLVTLLLGG